jgi:hypothetical protein
MPTSSSRHRVEIPLDLYHALNQAAADAHMPTSVLVTKWLWQMLEARRRDLHVRDPYRGGVEEYDRRPRRADELPDDRARSALLRPPKNPGERGQTHGTPLAENLTTVRLQPQKGATLSLADNPAAQS